MRDVRPYKTAWRVQVKVLHSWRQYTINTGETLEMVLFGEHGMKIHASIKKDLVVRFAYQMALGEWRFIENFGLTHASGQFRPTNHLYKMLFLNGTSVTKSEIKSDSNYLNVANFHAILNGDLNPFVLVDVLGQVVNIGEIQLLEANNKPTKKLEFELRDGNDDRLPCTLWGSFAEKVYSACEAADGIIVVCLIRFAKIKKYKGVTSVSNSFDASQVHINPNYPDVDAFTKSLPQDGLSLTIRQNIPTNQIISLKNDDYCNYPRKTIADLFVSTEVVLSLNCTYISLTV